MVYIEMANVIALNSTSFPLKIKVALSMPEAFVIHAA